MERKLPVKVSENLGIPREVVLFLEILENAVPIATGSCRKFKPDVLVEWKGPKTYKLKRTIVILSFLSAVFS